MPTHFEKVLKSCSRQAATETNLEEFMKIQLSDHFTYGRLLRFTLPSVAMMIFTSIYSVVDGFFVSNFAGKTPFAAVNLIMPVLMILGAVGFMFGTGGSAIVAKTFGEGDAKKANRYLSLFVYITFGAGVVLSILGIIFVRPVAILLGAEGELLKNCIIYARIILVTLPFYVLQQLFQSFMITAEKPRLGLAVIVSAGVTNMILDAVLVILLPQEYKLAGAAIATAISEIIGGGIPLLYFSRQNSSILKLGRTSFEGRAVLKACTNGSSELMTNVSMSLVAMLYNMQLMKYAGENGIAAYGVMMYVSMIFSGMFIGYAVGTAPVVSYHFGAKNYAELKNLLKKSLTVILLLAFCMVAASQLLAKPLAWIFVGYDAQLMAMTVSGFRIFAAAFLLMGFSIYGSSFFTALNDGLTSALIAFLRTLVFECSAVLLLPGIFGVNGIWSSVVVAECMSVALTFLFLALKRRKYNY